MRHISISLLLMLQIFFVGSSLGKETWMKEVNVKSPGPYLKIKPTKLEYTLSWNGAIKSGHMTFLIGKKDKRYPQYFVGQIYGGSSGLAKSIYNYKTNMVSFLNKKSYRPISFLGEDFEKDETVTTINRYRSSKVTSEETTKDKKGKPVSKKSKVFSYPNTFDLLSSMLYIRSFDLKKGLKKTLVVHPFASPYLAKVHVLGKETHKGKSCYKIDLKLQKIGSDMKLRTYKKMKRATLWITDDADRIPLELRTEVFIGDVRMTLKSKGKI